MVKGYKLEIFYFDELDSTQTYLLKSLKEKKYTAPVCIVALKQRSAKGSRSNKWESIEGNLMFSFAITKESLVEDIKLESLSVYLSYMLKLELEKLHSKLWMKWPNDFYINKKKIGGLITNISGNYIVCGIGLNLISAPQNAEYLDVTINKNKLLKSYFESLDKKPSWKQIFSKFKIEFELSREFISHNKDELIVLREAILLEDASLLYNNKKVFSLR